jgi:hypothetical protein
MRETLFFILISMITLQLSAQEEGFEKIFNGKDLSGWVGATDKYTIEDDGTLTTRSKTNIFTKKEYADFILRFEVKLASGANNGIGIRVPQKGGKATLECQILDNSSPKYENKKDYQYHGSLYSLVGAKRGFLKPVGEWNIQEISVIGKKIKVTLNGTVILDVDFETLKKSNAGTKRTQGHIALLGHGSGVHFRNLRVKDLAPLKAPADKE